MRVGVRALKKVTYLTGAVVHMNCRRFPTRHLSIPHRTPTTSAQRLIALFHDVEHPSDEQKILLGAAHYTLALQDTSIPRSKMHLNSAITRLHNTRNRTPNWFSLIANAYVKRAELLELENGYTTAIQDYQRALDVFEYRPYTTLLDTDKLLLAQSAISIADLSLHVKLEEPTPFHPLSYVNKALAYLSKIPRAASVRTTLAYANQMAGVALTPTDRHAAMRALRTAMAHAFQAESEAACRILSDIYDNMGLLYATYFETCAIQTIPPYYCDAAKLYFQMALLFGPPETLSFEERDILIESLSNNIEYVLCPHLPVPTGIIRDLADALVFLYYCTGDQSVSNKALCNQLDPSIIVDLYARYMHVLMAECYHRDNTEARLLEWINADDTIFRLDMDETLLAILSKKNKHNVYYLNANLSKHTMTHTG